MKEDIIIKKRMDEIKKDPSIAKSEKDLMKYLKKRGINLDI